MQDFVHLHVHTHYSLLDGQASVSRLVDKAMKDGMKGIAVTDHGNMFGIKEFINYVNKKNIGFDFKELRPLDSVKNARTPMLFIHGADDGLVPCFMVNELYEACSQEKKQLLIVEGADHAQSCMIGDEEYRTMLGSFIDEVLA